MWTRALCFEMAALTERITCCCYQAVETLDKVDAQTPAGGPPGMLSHPSAPSRTWRDAFVGHIRRAYYALKDLADVGVLQKTWLESLRNALQTAVNQRNRGNYNPRNPNDVRLVKNELLDIINKVRALQTQMEQQPCRSEGR